MSHYKITPLEKKSIIAHYEMYRENADGTVSWFNLEDHYRWGSGFLAEDEECNLNNASGNQAYAKMDQGEYEGCEFDDSVACYWEFSDDITEEEQEKIKNCYCYGDDDDDGRGGAGWLYEGNHEWQFEDEYVTVLGPYKIEFCEEDGTVVREVKLRTRDEQEKLQESLGEGWYIPYDSALEPEKWK